MSLPPWKIKVSASIWRGTKRIDRSFCKYYFIYGNKYRQDSSYCQGCIFLRETMVYFLIYEYNPSFENNWTARNLCDPAIGPSCALARRCVDAHHHLHALEWPQALW